MSGACGSIPVTPGDTLDVRINLFSGSDGNKVPLQMAPGEVFVLRFGNIVASTAAQGPGRLQVQADAEQTSFLRQFTPNETIRFKQDGQGCKVPTDFAFSRIPTKGVHRTYLAGPITVAANPNGGTQVSYDVTVTEGGIEIDMGPVPDAASYTDAVATELRAEMASNSADSNALSAAYALLL